MACVRSFYQNEQNYLHTDHRGNPIVSIIQPCNCDNNVFAKFKLHIRNIPGR